MAWGRQDDGYYDHPKTLQLSLQAIGLEWLAIAYANRHHTDGVVTKAVAVMLARGEHVTLFDELVRSGRWEAEGDGFRIHDFLDYNLAAKQSEKKRKQAKERMRSLRKRSQSVLECSRVTADDLGTGTGDLSACSFSSGKGEVQEGEGFDRFWEPYPNKLSKKKAREAWKQVHGDAYVAAILAGLTPWLVYWTERNEPQYVTQGATWLRDERWTKLPPARSSGGKAERREDRTIANLQAFVGGVKP